MIRFKQLLSGLICLFLALQLCGTASAFDIHSFSHSKDEIYFKSKQEVSTQNYFVSFCFEDDSTDGDEDYHHAEALRNPAGIFVFRPIKDLLRVVDSSIVLHTKRIPFWKRYRQIIR